MDLLCRDGVLARFCAGDLPGEGNAGAAHAIEDTHLGGDRRSCGYLHSITQLRPHLTIQRAAFNGDRIGRHSAWHYLGRHQGCFNGWLAGSHGSSQGKR